MGIHPDWMKIFKEECPDAFAPAPPVRPAAAFIDGQIQLMKAQGVLSWDQFVQYQFVTPVRRMLVRVVFFCKKDVRVVFFARKMFTRLRLPAHSCAPQRERGATTVVLAFDDYTHVPLAKGMTQVRGGSTRGSASACGRGAGSAATRGSGSRACGGVGAART